MTSMIKIAVDAMGGDNSPEKIIKGIIHHHKNNSDVFYKIFGNKDKITPIIKDKINRVNYEVVNTLKEEKTLACG